MLVQLFYHLGRKVVAWFLHLISKYAILSRNGAAYVSRTISINQTNDYCTPGANNELVKYAR
jgi:hypothetical protein